MFQTFSYVLLHTDYHQLTESYIVEKVKEMLGDIMTECFDRAKAQQKSEGYIKLERDFASIPLPGNDVPGLVQRGMWPLVCCDEASILTASHLRFSLASRGYRSCFRESRECLYSPRPRHH
jgi:hypothetical protein